jgi:lipoprotein NlpI
VIEDTGAVIGREPSNSDGYFLRTRAKLYSNDAGSAAEDVAAALKIVPSYAYFPIWLHIAQTRAGRNGTSELPANAENLDPAQWPYPIVGLFLGTLTPDALAAAAHSDDADTQRDQACEVGFYLGVYLLDVKGERGPARQQLELAVQTCPHAFVEYHAAKIELERLR